MSSTTLPETRIVPSCRECGEIISKVSNYTTTTTTTTTIIHHYCHHHHHHYQPRLPPTTTTTTTTTTATTTTTTIATNDNKWKLKIAKHYWCRGQRFRATPRLCLSSDVQLTLCLKARRQEPFVAECEKQQEEDKKQQQARTRAQYPQNKVRQLKGVQSRVPTAIAAADARRACTRAGRCLSTIAHFRLQGSVCQCFLRQK
ncbi:hypothetical protein E2C01_034092 [Portunus trituberculatus]|uniref:Uncharacterized protein n=1 Tax=Portunus trituberculatus TaxID=210409 RepID=A0A5B7F1X0_PORTR|nr:hypothetical protein [Portunus trituberculatus]